MLFPFPFWAVHHHHQCSANDIRTRLLITRLVGGSKRRRNKTRAASAPRPFSGAVVDRDLVPQALLFRLLRNHHLSQLRW